MHVARVSQPTWLRIRFRQIYWPLVGTQSTLMYMSCICACVFVHMNVLDTYQSDLCSQQEGWTIQGMLVANPMLVAKCLRGG